MATNDYFNHEREDIPSRSKVSSGTLNNIMDAVTLGFGELPAKADLVRGQVHGIPTTGAGNTYLATVGKVTEYEDFLRLSIKIHEVNTAASTINVNGLGAKSIRKFDGSNVSAGDLALNAIVDIVYNETAGYFSMIVPPMAVFSTLITDAANASSAATTATAAAATATTKAAQTTADKVATAADAVATAADRVATTAHVATTGAAVVLTTANAEATGEDATATAADRVQTGLDRVQTGLDKIATAASAASAVAIAGAFVDTSTTSWTPTIQEKVFTVSSGNLYVEGVYLSFVSNGTPSAWAIGQVVSYVGTTLTMDMQVINGSGTHTDWNISLVGVPGAKGDAGELAGIATGTVELLTGANIASASTVNLDAATGNRVSITGTTTITAITLTRGPRTVVFAGALTLTHHATNNNLPGGVNITTAAGDRAIYEKLGSVVYCVGYFRANGQALVGAGMTREIKTSSFTAVQNMHYLIDVTAGAVTVTLPSSPSITTNPVIITHYRGNVVSNPITIARNSANIMGLAENMTMNTANATANLAWASTTEGWRLIGL